jgi:hypothetical protein
MLLPQHTCSSTRCVRTSSHSQVITVAAISEKLKVNGSLARRSIDELVKRGLIKCVARHSAQRIYTKVCVRMDDLVVPSFHAPVPVVVPSQFQLGPMANVRVLFSHPFPEYLSLFRDTRLSLADCTSFRCDLRRRAPRSCAIAHHYIPLTALCIYRVIPVTLPVPAPFPHCVSGSM